MKGSNTYFVKAFMDAAVSCGCSSAKRQAQNTPP
jgi:hypothetical protein